VAQKHSELEGKLGRKFLSEQAFFFQKGVDNKW
jgi:hypothetical protein